MARIDQVRSHLRELANSIWEGEPSGPDQTTLTFKTGSAITSLYAQDDPAGPFVVVSCAIAVNVPPTPELFQWLNERNVESAAKFTFEEGTIFASEVMIADDVDRTRLQNAVEYVARSSDLIDDDAVATFGGQLPNPE